MSLVLHPHYYDPFSEFDRLFDDALSSRFSRPSTTTVPTTDVGRDLYRPKMDVHENPDTNTVTATFDLPGLAPNQVNIDIHQDRLSVTGETSSAQDREESGYTVRERSWGKFSRTLMLPQGTTADDVKAKMENGTLNVTFPKALQQSQPKRITIN